MKKLNFTKEQLEEKKSKLLEKLDIEIENKKQGVSPTQQFLLEIKEVVQKGLDSNLPFTVIAKSINTTFNINISSTSIRAFAVTNLGYIPKASNVKKEVKKEVKNDVKNEAKNDVKNDVNQEAKTIEQMKSASNSNNDVF